MYRFLLSLALVIICMASNAQPDILSITTTESTCENNGTLSVSAVNVSGTGSLSYILTAGPAGAPYPITIQEPNTTFYSLYPGNYVLRVEDVDGGSSTGSATVPGEYLQLDLLLNGTDPLCPGALDGTITATMTLGNDPYEYEITGGPVTAPRGTSNLFTGLSEGSYTVVAYDSCDNFQTRTWVLSDPVLTPFSASVGFYVPRISCDSARFDVGASGGKGPYTYEVIAPIFLPAQSNFQFVLQKDPEYTFRVTDACGNANTAKKRYVENMYPFTHSKTCSTFSLSISNFLTFGEDLSYELYASDGTTLVDGPQSNDNTFSNVPFGFYYIHVTNECGETKILNRGAAAPPTVNFTSTNSYTSSCNINTSNARVFVSSNTSFPVTYTMLEQPSGFTPPPPTTTNSSFGTYANLILGSYKIEAEDACGGKDTIDFDITDVHTITFAATEEAGCGLSDNRIQATATSSESGTIFIYKLFNEATGVQLALNNDGNFNNLDSGTYVVLIDICGNQDFRDTIHFDGYKQPDVSPVFGVLCDNGTVTISCNGVDGKPPYLYDIVQGPELRPQQSAPLFENLPIGNNYRVRVEDACGNTFNRDVSVDTFPQVNIAERGRSCVGEKVQMETDTIGGASYLWTGPNGFVSTARSPEFPNLTTSDSGLYVLKLSLGSCSKEKFVQKNLRVTQSCILPVDLAYFNARYDAGNKKVHLKWETYSEINVAYFEIQRSNNGRDWMMVDVIEAKGSENTTSSYVFLDEQPLPNLSYYRLLMIDSDGSSDLSEVKVVFRDMTKTIVVSPNPTKQGNINVFLKQGPDSGVVSIFDHLGRLVASQPFSEEQVINVDIDLLPSGLYYARVDFADDSYYTQKFVKIDP